MISNTYLTILKYLCAAVSVKSPLNIPAYLVLCKYSDFNLQLCGGLFLDSLVLTAFPNTGFIATVRTRSRTSCSSSETRSLIRVGFFWVFFL